jgi:hypothetical protein
LYYGSWRWKNRATQMQFCGALKDLKECKKEIQPPSIIIVIFTGSTSGLMSPRTSVSSYNKSIQQLLRKQLQQWPLVAKQINQKNHLATLWPAQSSHLSTNQGRKSQQGKLCSHQAQVTPGNKKVENCVEKQAFKAATLTLSTDHKKCCLKDICNRSISKVNPEQCPNAGTKIGVSPVWRGP